ncbi:ATP-dependent DNA helicase RecG [Acetobacterium tundrae]|uniref:ATP-dependent DNA helicase RecG n=1 Tax=Acetobacterium tundrae TaxID=132932 RepID=A0ABR6WG34_9FIRM|nr:ATP-dependent DNA helicase RecG [Acetobacterium tundrae]MBC3795482.1 ATP-dependent DNA helicase RecG [Acetobacterium tundrae]
MKWEDSLINIKGVGPKRKEALEKHGIKTIGDLLSFYPRKYIDRNVLGSTDNISEESEVSIRAQVLNKGRVQRIRGNLSIFTLSLLWEDKKIAAVFFNQPYLKNTLHEYQEYFFYGKIKTAGAMMKIMNPQFVAVENPGSFFELTPVYSHISGIPNNTIHKILTQIFSDDLEIADHLPESIRRSEKLLDLKAALKAIHFPKRADEVLRGIERLKFNEALKINIGIISNSWGKKVSDISITSFEGINILMNNLPYELTKSQRAVIDDMMADIKSGQVMNRLVQGDVGSGKTVIAIIAACLMAQNGYQTAYMAPTEILAQQHGRNFKELLVNMGISVEVVTGSIKAKEKKEILDRVAKGAVSIIIGTHALIQESLEYYNLGMVITDEQHRFGVKQRSQLALKGNQPHTMVMSATPIPRTLSLILYGDLSVSYIDELPKGRKPIKTYCYDEASLHKIVAFLEDEIVKGRQSFVICPFIEASEEMEEVRDTETVYNELQKKMNPKYQIGCLHGRLKNDDKESIIKAFNQGEIDCLVATSIIEVGIDVPNVSAMVILSADRFGLSQLHQLRGRVGRGKHQSYCFLVTNSKSKETLSRMKVIVNNSSGKKIADEDFRLRGPGDYFGFKQHGLPKFGLLNPMEELALIEKTKIIADMIFQSNEKEMMNFRNEVLQSFYQDIEEVSFT